MNRSFRFQLAARAAATMAAALVAIGIVGVLVLKAALDREIDASIMSVASIQAATLTDAPSGEMHFHEWDLTPDEATSVRDLIRYAQVWRVDGVSLLRSRFMTSDLPLDREHLGRAGSGELVWSQAVFNGVPIRTVYYPLERFGAAHERHVLQVAAPLERRNTLLARVSIFLGALIALVTSGTFLGAGWLAGRAVRPVAEVVDQAEEIGAGSLDRRIQAYADTREYRRLVEVLNTMLQRIHHAFEAQRHFTADASHELRSPLTAMRGELELALRRERTDEEYRRVLESTLEEVVRLTRIVEDLLTLARSDSGALRPRHEPMDATELVARVVERLRPQASARGVAVDLTGTGPTPVRADAGLLSQVIWNLTENAIRVTPEGGRVSAGARLENGDLVLEVEDTGPGLGDVDPERLFARFYRADEARSQSPGPGGVGLGLAIAKALAEAHGGTLRAEDGTGGGARFVARVPHEAWS